MADRDPLVYWIDRCLGADEVPDALRAIGVAVERYVDTYPTDPRVEDVVWIREITASGLVIVTKDKNIRRDAAERSVLETVGARYVCLAQRGSRESSKRSVSPRTGGPSTASSGPVRRRCW